MMIQVSGEGSSLEQLTPRQVTLLGRTMTPWLGLLQKLFVYHELIAQNCLPSEISLSLDRPIIFTTYDVI